MRDIFSTTLYKKDLKRERKRGKDPKKLRDVVDKLLSNKPLDRKLRAHRLVGNKAPYWVCHIKPDWSAPNYDTQIESFQ